MICDVLIVVDDCDMRQWIGPSLQIQSPVTASWRWGDSLWSIEALAASLNCRLSILVVFPVE